MAAKAQYPNVAGCSRKSRPDHSRPNSQGCCTDGKGMANAIIRLATDEKMRNKLRKKAYKTFAKGPRSPKILGDRTLSAYQYAKQAYNVRSQ